MGRELNGDVELLSTSVLDEPLLLYTADLSLTYNATTISTFGSGIYDDTHWRGDLTLTGVATTQRPATDPVTEASYTLGMAIVETTPCGDSEVELTTLETMTLVSDSAPGACVIVAGKVRASSGETYTFGATAVTITDAADNSIVVPCGSELFSTASACSE